MTDLTLAADPLRSEFLALAATAEPWQPSAEPVLIVPEAEDQAAPPATDGRGGARLLPMLAACPLLCDPYGQCYIVIVGEPLALDSKNSRLIETVADMYYRATDQTIGKDALTAAVNVLSYRARTAGEPAPMANRCAPYGDALAYDLGHGSAARITAGSWDLIAAPPGLFRPWSHKLPHPTPTAPGNAWRLFKLVNVAEDDRLLVLASLAACIVPGIARPCLVITGPQGSGKSTAAKIFKLLLDPGTPALTLMPRKPEDLDLMLARNMFLALDNLSRIAPDVADTMAGVITQAAPQRRRLHTDDELLTLRADVTLCLTSITSLSDRPDFLERCLRVRLDRIEDLDRRADDELDEAFSVARADILGGLLTLLARGLELLPSYRPPRLPRMATFARIAAAVAEAAEPGAGARYLAAFAANQGGQHLELAEGNLLFGAILEACAAGNWPAGTFKEIVGNLKEIADPGPKDPFPTARGLRRALERLRVPLHTAGVAYEIDDHRTAAGKASVCFSAVERIEDQAAPEPEDTPAPPELSGLVFDPGELDR